MNLRKKKTQIDVRCATFEVCSRTELPHAIYPVPLITLNIHMLQRSEGINQWDEWMKAVLQQFVR